MKVIQKLKMNTKLFAIIIAVIVAVIAALLLYFKLFSKHLPSENKIELNDTSVNIVMG